MLKAVDLAAKRQKVNRSALIREALREYLKRMRERELDEQERRGYEAHPHRAEECLPWLKVASWPED